MLLSTPELNRVRLLFLDALDFNESDRARFLAEREHDTPAPLRHEVVRLLHAHDSAGAFLAEPTLPPRLIDIAPPQTIGPYRILRELGRGGFGTVYLTQQERPVRRQVALKLINPGMDTQQVVARFEAERQALALMDHPGIAKIFDAGATEAGRPYFVMEWVVGESLTTFCATHRLDLRARLDLFVLVCRAVQHAHQQGVIHRDIKPSNILVAMRDGMPAPKVIDFGVAKALRDRLTDSTLLTEQKQLIGTPQYMSPEQATTGLASVDTRVDVYGLGVLLYEMLTETAPFDAVRLRSATLAELERIIREEEPPLPSRRVTENASVSVQPAEARRLSLSLRRDLDWIVARAMEKDRTRRYATVDALADDVLRHLNHEPVRARSPGAGYLLSKFVRRHRRALATAAIAIAALSAGSGFGIYGLVQARDQQAIATQASAARTAQEALAESSRRLADAQQQLAKQQRQRADENQMFLDRNTSIVEAAQNLLVFLFSSNFAGREQSPLSAAMLNALDARMSTSPRPIPPDLAGPVHDALGTSFQRLNMPKEAEEQHRIAIRLTRQAAVVFGEAVATSYNNLASALLMQGRYEEAEIELREALRWYDDASYNSLTLDLLPNICCNLAVTHAHMDEDPAIALQWLAEAQSAAKHLTRDPMRIQGEVTEAIAHAFRDVGQFKLASQLQTEADAMYKKAGGAKRSSSGSATREL